jgi:hypothetical protein
VAEFLVGLSFDVDERLRRSLYFVAFVEEAFFDVGPEFFQDVRQGIVADLEGEALQVISGSP